MNWVVISCFAVLVALGLIGLKLGVVKMLYHLVAFALALVLTAAIAPMPRGLSTVQSEGDAILGGDRADGFEDRCKGRLGDGRAH